MGNQASSASQMLNLWKRDVTPDRSSTHHGRGGTVGGGGNCAVDTGVSKQSNVGRKETMVGSSEVVVGHTSIAYKHVKSSLPMNKAKNKQISTTTNTIFTAIYSKKAASLRNTVNKYCRSAYSPNYVLGHFRVA